MYIKYICIYIHNLCILDIYVYIYILCIIYIMYIKYIYICIYIYIYPHTYPYISIYIYIYIYICMYISYYTFLIILKRGQFWTGGEPPLDETMVQRWRVPNKEVLHLTHKENIKKTEEILRKLGELWLSV